MLTDRDTATSGSQYKPWARGLRYRRYRVSVPKDRWLDRDAGPVVRPYAVTMSGTVPAFQGDAPGADPTW